MSVLPLRIAFLWHNHQPYYKMDDEFILPWVRFHCVKDYCDLALLLNEFPKIKQTVNLVPSVLLQINEYLESGITDVVQRLTKIQANHLTIEEKTKILELFFICNEQNMILPHFRYRELFEMSKESNAVNFFTDQDWLDLQVWYNLTWLGEFSKQRPFAQRLFRKGMNFTEQEKLLLLELHNEIMSELILTYRKLVNLEQLSVSTTPYYHPILPLLVNSDSAKEANSDNLTLEPNFSFPEDAKYQIELSIEHYKNIFNSYPSGFWPSEGSISNEVLKIFIQKQIRWAATDEDILFASEIPKNHLEKYFPRKYNTEIGEITIYFRDHILSDKIGFEYANWKPFDSASNFVHSLLNIRSNLLDSYGEEALRNAVVPIILDGENCWEFYPNNGFDFLRILYSQISDNPFLKTIFLDESANDGSNEYLPSLNSIQAGSWINANFNIWIGHPDDITAWEYLRNVRQIFEIKKSSLPEEISENIYNELLIAEGSDWFWWYGPEHNAPNKPDFDMLFRWRIKRIYEMLGESPPLSLNNPLGRDQIDIFKLPASQIKLSNGHAWDNAGYFIFKQHFSTMHQTDKPEVKILFGNDEDFIYFIIENLQENSNENKLTFRISDLFFEIEPAESNYKVSTISLEDLTFSENSIFFKISLVNLFIAEDKLTISFKLINLAEKKEELKTFEYYLI